MLGWVAGVFAKQSPIATPALFAFLAGGVVLNVLEDELPEDCESRSWVFAVGTTAYAVLLLVTR